MSELLYKAPVVAAAPAPAADSSSLSADISAAGSVREYFSVAETVAFLSRLPAHPARVALQFPDSLLPYAPELAKTISEEAKVTTIVLADSSFAGCCVDEVAAVSYAKADAVIHYGDACLSRFVAALPVFYVFGKKMLDVSRLEQELRTWKILREVDDGIMGLSGMIIVYDLAYHHKLNELKLVSENLRKEFPEVDFQVADLKFTSTVTTVEDREEAGRVLSPERKLDEKESSESFTVNQFVFNLSPPGGFTTETNGMDGYTFLYIGGEGSALTALMMNRNANKVFSYNPTCATCATPGQVTIREESIFVNKMLMRRYYLIQKAKDATTIGILVGTLGVEKFKEAIDRIKFLIKSNGKKYYTVLVGKINDPKLANFVDIDIFVLVACPQSVLLDTYSFIKDVVTPFELEMALRDDWELSQYTTDFAKVLDKQLPETSDEVRDDEEEEGAPRFSLVSRKLISAPSEKVVSSASELVPVSEQRALISAERLAEKEFRGLDPRYGKDEPGKLEKGLSGIPKGYK